MIQILPERENFSSLIGASLGQGLNQGLGLALNRSEQERQSKRDFAQQLGLENYKSGLRRQEIADELRGKRSAELEKQAQLDQVAEMLGLPAGTPESILGQYAKHAARTQGLQSIRNRAKSDSISNTPDSVISNNIPNQEEIEQLLNAGYTQEANVLQNIAKQQRKTFESDRAYHSQIANKTLEDANKIRESLSKKKNALAMARNAIESNEVGFFSPDKLADTTGIDLFRTSKGAQLVTAGKENLLSNMSKVSSKAQNMWFEQRLNSMFPKIGQSLESNLTVQEMLEGEVALENVYLNALDRISEEDVEKYGFERKDIEKRARKAIEPLEKEILNRTSYRLKEIEEQEKGLSFLKKQAGKKVIKGTPLTLAMAKTYKEKFGDKALDMAKKNGYSIPTIEEFKIYQMRPQEYLEND